MGNIFSKKNDDTCVENIRFISNIGAFAGKFNGVDTVTWNNSVRTAKYSKASFIPLNLLQQLKSGSNPYFLSMAALQCWPAVSDTGGAPMLLLPLCFVVFIAMIKDFSENTKREDMDRKENGKLIQRINKDYETLENTTWSKLCVGDVVLVKGGDPFPADLILLACSSDLGVVNVETKNLDGETNLKQKTIIPEIACHFFQNTYTHEDGKLDWDVIRDNGVPVADVIAKCGSKCLISVQAEPPCESLYTFNARVCINSVPDQFIHSSALDESRFVRAGHANMRSLVKRRIEALSLPSKCFLMNNQHQRLYVNSGETEVNDPKTQGQPQVVHGDLNSVPVPLSVRNSHHNQMNPASEPQNQKTDQTPYICNATRNNNNKDLLISKAKEDLTTTPCWNGVSLSTNQLLLRGSNFAGVGWCIGLVVYNGHYTRIYRNNSSEPPIKRSYLTKMIDEHMIVLIIAQFGLSLLFAILTVLVDMDSYWYLTAESSSQSLVYEFFVVFFSQVIQLTLLVPISLPVTMEVLKFVQALRLHKDPTLKSVETNKGVFAQTTSVLDDLGAVSHIFSDKTGTLTKNLMQFVCFGVGDNAYGLAEFIIAKDEARKNATKVNLTENDGALGQNEMKKRKKKLKGKGAFFRKNEQDDKNNDDYSDDDDIDSEIENDNLFINNDDTNERKNDNLRSNSIREVDSILQVNRGSSSGGKSKINHARCSIPASDSGDAANFDLPLTARRQEDVQKNKYELKNPLNDAQEGNNIIFNNNNLRSRDKTQVVSRHAKQETDSARLEHTFFNNNSSSGSLRQDNNTLLENKKLREQKREEEIQLRCAPNPFVHFDVRSFFEHTLNAKDCLLDLCNAPGASADDPLIESTIDFLQCVRFSILNLALCHAVLTRNPIEEICEASLNEVPSPRDLQLKISQYDINDNIVQQECDLIDKKPLSHIHAKIADSQLKKSLSNNINPNELKNGMSLHNDDDISPFYGTHSSIKITENFSNPSPRILQQKEEIEGIYSDSSNSSRFIYKAYLPQPNENDSYVSKGDFLDEIENMAIDNNNIIPEKVNRDPITKNLSDAVFKDNKNQVNNHIRVSTSDDSRDNQILPLISEENANSNEKTLFLHTNKVQDDFRLGKSQMTINNNYPDGISTSRFGLTSLPTGSLPEDQPNNNKSNLKIEQNADDNDYIHLQTPLPTASTNNLHEYINPPLAATSSNMFPTVSLLPPIDIHGRHSTPRLSHAASNSSGDFLIEEPPTSTTPPVFSSLPPFLPGAAANFVAPVIDPTSRLRVVDPSIKFLSPTVSYDASSPDELALVSAAQHLGLEFSSRPTLRDVELKITRPETLELLSFDPRSALFNGWQNILKTDGSLNGVFATQISPPVPLQAGENQANIPMKGENISTMKVNSFNFSAPSIHFKVLRVLDFDNDRKRMSVIVEDRQHRICLLCKGADSAMFQVAGENSWNEYRRERIHAQLSVFSELGLRTLVLGYRLITADEFEEIDSRFSKIHGELQDVVAGSSQEAKLKQELASLIHETESNIEVVGCSAIEDQLQDEVAEVIEDLKAADVKLWVLTGDKLETAINIGHSCGILDDETYTGILKSTNKKKILDELKDLEEFLKAKNELLVFVNINDDEDIAGGNHANVNNSNGNNNPLHASNIVSPATKVGGTITPAKYNNNNNNSYVNSPPYTPAQQLLHSLPTHHYQNNMTSNNRHQQINTHNKGNYSTAMGDWANRSVLYHDAPLPGLIESTSMTCNNANMNYINNALNGSLSFHNNPLIDDNSSDENDFTIRQGINFNKSVDPFLDRPVNNLNYHNMNPNSHHYVMQQKQKGTALLVSDPDHSMPFATPSTTLTNFDQNVICSSDLESGMTNFFKNATSNTHKKSEMYNSKFLKIQHMSSSSSSSNSPSQDSPKQQEAPNRRLNKLFLQNDCGKNACSSSLTYFNSPKQSHHSNFESRHKNPTFHAPRNTLQPIASSFSHHPHFLFGDSCSQTQSASSPSLYPKSRFAFSCVNENIVLSDSTYKNDDRDHSQHVINFQNERAIYFNKKEKNNKTNLLLSEDPLFHSSANNINNQFPYNSQMTDQSHRTLDDVLKENQQYHTPSNPLQMTSSWKQKSSASNTTQLLANSSGMANQNNYINNEHDSSSHVSLQIHKDKPISLSSSSLSDEEDEGSSIHDKSDKKSGRAISDSVFFRQSTTNNNLSVSQRVQMNINNSNENIQSNYNNGDIHSSVDLHKDKYNSRHLISQQHIEASRSPSPLNLGHPPEGGSSLVFKGSSLLSMMPNFVMNGNTSLNSGTDSARHQKHHLENNNIDFVTSNNSSGGLLSYSQKFNRYQQEEILNRNNNLAGILHQNSLSKQQINFIPSDNSKIPSKALFSLAMSHNNNFNPHYDFLPSQNTQHGNGTIVEDDRNPRKHKLHSSHERQFTLVKSSVNNFGPENDHSDISFRNQADKMNEMPMAFSTHENIASTYQPTVINNSSNQQPNIVDQFQTKSPFSPDNNKNNQMTALMNQQMVNRRSTVTPGRIRPLAAGVEGNLLETFKPYAFYTSEGMISNQFVHNNMPSAQPPSKTVRKKNKSLTEHRDDALDQDPFINQRNAVRHQSDFGLSSQTPRAPLQSSEYASIANGGGVSIEPTAPSGISNSNIVNANHLLTMYRPTPVTAQPVAPTYINNNNNHLNMTGTFSNRALKPIISSENPTLPSNLNPALSFSGGAGGSQYANYSAPTAPVTNPDLPPPKLSQTLPKIPLEQIANPQGGANANGQQNLPVGAAMSPISNPNRPTSGIHFSSVVHQQCQSQFGHGIDINNQSINSMAAHQRLLSRRVDNHVKQLELEALGQANIDCTGNINNINMNASLGNQTSSNLVFNHNNSAPINKSGNNKIEDENGDKIVVPVLHVKRLPDKGIPMTVMPQRHLSHNKNLSAPAKGFSHLSLAVSGDTLAVILKTQKLKERFFRLCEFSKTVIACRVTPKQKQMVVETCRERHGSHILTLAIGDGANDVGMIRAAHIGVGVEGKEGSQATRASDFSIPEFKTLRALLFDYGSETARSFPLFAYTTVYKNIALSMTQVFFCFSNLFSGGNYFSPVIKQLYNTILVPVSICYVAVFDHGLPKNVKRQGTRLYRNAPFGFLNFLQMKPTPHVGWLWMAFWCLYGVYCAAVNYYVPIYAIVGPGNEDAACSEGPCPPGTFLDAGMISMINIVIQSNVMIFLFAYELSTIHVAAYAFGPVIMYAGFFIVYAVGDSLDYTITDALTITHLFPDVRYVLIFFICFCIVILPLCFAYGLNVVYIPTNMTIIRERLYGLKLKQPLPPPIGAHPLDVIVPENHAKNQQSGGFAFAYDPHQLERIVNASAPAARMASASNKQNVQANIAEYAPYDEHSDYNKPYTPLNPTMGSRTVITSHHNIGTKIDVEDDENYDALSEPMTVRRVTQSERMDKGCEEASEVLSFHLI